MAAILTVLAVVALSVLVTRIAAVALRLTGLPRETARFQARSAFTGVGFTTREAESVTIHPDRRRIVLTLMLLGNAGIASAIAGLMISFLDAGEASEALRRGGVLVGGLVLMTVLAHSRWIERRLAPIIEWILLRTTSLEAVEDIKLLDLEGDYQVSRLEIRPGSWLAGRTLRELELPDEGVLALAIIRGDGSYVGSPRGSYSLRAGDTLVLYGPGPRLGELRHRVSGEVGERMHREARTQHQLDLERQDEEDAPASSRGLSNKEAM